MARRAPPLDPNDEPAALAPEQVTGLELFDDESFADLVSYFYRLAGDGQREGPEHGYCYKAYGVLDPDTVKTAIGGGLYRVIVKSGQSITKRLLVRIAGWPRKLEPQPADGPANGAAPAAADGMGALRDEVRELRAALVSRNNTGDSLKETIALLSSAGILQPRPDPGALFGQLSQVYASGLEAGRKGEPDDSAAAVIREAVNGITAIMASRVTSPAPAAAPAAATAAPTPARAAAADTAAMLTTAIVRAWRLAREPDEAADTIETLVSESDLVRVRGIPDAVAVSQVTAAAGALEPGEAEALSGYVIGVLTELRSPPDEGGDKGGG